MPARCAGSPAAANLDNTAAQFELFLERQPAATPESEAAFRTFCRDTCFPAAPQSGSTGGGAGDSTSSGAAPSAPLGLSFQQQAF